MGRGLKLTTTYHPLLYYQPPSATTLRYREMVSLEVFLEPYSKASPKAFRETSPYIFPKTSCRDRRPL